MARRGSSHEYAVIGLGRFGTSLALNLVQSGHHVLGIDRSMEIVQSLSDDLTRTVAMDATNTDALQAIDIASFETVIVAIGTSFENNLLVTVELKSLGVRTVVCKATSERQRTILLRVGADRVVLPEHDAGLRLARELTEPGILDRLELGSGYSISEIPVPHRLAGKTLAAANLRRTAGINVLVIKRAGETIVSPLPDFTLHDGDTMVVLGESEQIWRVCDGGVRG